MRVLKDFPSFLSQRKAIKRSGGLGMCTLFLEPVRCRRPFGDEAHCRTAEHPHTSSSIRGKLDGTLGSPSLELYSHNLLHKTNNASITSWPKLQHMMHRTADHHKWSPSLLHVRAPLHYRFSHFINKFHLLLHPWVRHFFVIEMHQRLRSPSSLLAFNISWSLWPSDIIGIINSDF
jgi:hypothetical protein